MADRVLFIGWDRAFPGKEKEALEAFGASVAFYGKQVAAGAIDSFEPVMLELHGGDLNGFMILRGSAEQLAALQASDEFRDLLYKANLSVSGIGLVSGFGGESLGREMARWQKVIS